MTASLLSACGSVAPRQAARAQSLPSSFKYLHTLNIASGVSKADLEQRYGGYVVAYQPESNTAIIASNSLSLSSDSRARRSGNRHG